MFSRKRRKFYPKNKYSNPFFQSKKRVIKNRPSKFLLNMRFIGGLIMLIVFAWFFLFFSYFNISSIEVTGNGRTSLKEIEDLAWKQTEKSRIFLGSQKNINLFNKNEFTDKLKNDYNFKNLKITKYFPSKIVIKLEEKAYSSVWQEAENYYYINDDGEIISNVDLLEINSKEIPVIENRGNQRINNKIVNIDKNNLLFIKNLFFEFKNNYKDFEFDKFAINDKDKFIILKLIKGPEIYFNPEVDINDQLYKFLVVSQKLKAEIFNKRYIDLTHGDRVYYE